MWTEIINLALSNGLWAVLFVVLLLYVLRDSKVRETKYQDTIASLNSSLTIVQSIKEDIDEIKECINLTRGEDDEI